MHLFNRNETIPNLLGLLDIPKFFELYETCDCIGPSDPNVFAEYKLRRLKKEAAAIAALKNATDEELWELSETPGCLSSFEMKYCLFDSPPWYAGGFGVERHKADFAYWVKMDFWTLEEATCLSIGFTPEKIPECKLGLRSPYQSVNFYHDRVELFRRINFQNRKMPYQIEPMEFVNWARKKGIEIPSELEKSVNENHQVKRPAMLGTVDARKYDSAIKLILGLIANEYGYRKGIVEKDIKQATMKGLAELGLNIDPKTLNRLYNEAVKSADRFRSEQEKRDM